jgi:hypothetical protein
MVRRDAGPRYDGVIDMTKYAQEIRPADGLRWIWRA